MTKSSANSRLWARSVGLLLILAALLVRLDSLGWLFAGDGTIESRSFYLAVTAGRVGLLLAGLMLLVWPRLIAALAGFKTAVVGAAACLFAVGAVGTLGVVFAPPVDYLIATYPAFTCSATDAFCNRTQTAGLMGERRYGKGAAFVDINGDGWVDLYAADADRRLGEDGWGLSAFYLNDQDGTFTRAGLGISEADLLSNWTASFADTDNDGDLDLLIGSGGYAGESRLSFYENRYREEGRFVAVTGAAGFEDYNSRPRRWWGLAWADYDNDGLLDVAIARVYGEALIFRNQGGNRFRDVTKELGITTPMARRRDGKNIVWFDYDGDGDQDIYFAGIEAHMFYANEGAQGFRDVTEEVFAGALPPNVNYSSDSPVVFAAAAADFDQDGDEDLYLGRQSEQDVVLFNDGRGRFTAGARDIGIDPNLISKTNKSADFENTMGLGIGDIFNDGWPDVVMGSGDPKRADMDVVYCNNGGVFSRCTELLRANADGPFRTRTHGIVFGDVNQDGASDIFQNLGGDGWWDRKLGIDSREHGALFVANPPADLRTATLLLEGTASNRDAIGARVVVETDRTHYYTLHSSQSFQSQNDPAIIVALGAADEAQVRVEWPSGRSSELTVRPGERRLVKE